MKNPVPFALILAVIASTAAADPVTSRYPFPPAEFDHPHNGTLYAHVVGGTEAVNSACNNPKFNLGCSSHVGDICFVYVASDATARKFGWTPEEVMRHEIGHCNGWPGDHANARTREKAGRAPYDIPRAVLLMDKASLAKVFVAEWEIKAKAFIEWHNKVKAHIEAVTALKAKAGAYADAFTARAVKTKADTDAFAAWTAKVEAGIEAFTEWNAKVKASIAVYCKVFAQQAALKRVESEAFVEAVATCKGLTS
jgi:hypothetical protein